MLILLMRRHSLAVTTVPTDAVVVSAIHPITVTAVACSTELHRSLSSSSSPSRIVFADFTYLCFLNFLRLSLSLSRFVVSLSGSFLERPDLLMPYMSGFSSHSRLDSCLTLTFVSVLWFELLLWKLSLCAGASDFSDFSESEPDPEPEPLEELESLR